MLTSREEVVDAFGDLNAAMRRVTALSFDALTTPERLALLEQLEQARRLLPVAEHPLVNQLHEQASREELGGNLAHGLATRLRITRAEANRRIHEAHDLGERHTLTRSYCWQIGEMVS
jgi:hypothetical protein